MSLSLASRRVQFLAVDRTMLFACFRTKEWSLWEAIMGIDSWMTGTFWTSNQWPGLQFSWTLTYPSILTVCFFGRQAEASFFQGRNMKITKDNSRRTPSTSSNSQTLDNENSILSLFTSLQTANSAFQEVRQWPVLWPSILPTSSLSVEPSPTARTRCLYATVLSALIYKRLSGFLLTTLLKLAVPLKPFTATKKYTWLEDSVEKIKFFRQFSTSSSKLTTSKPRSVARVEKYTASRICLLKGKAFTSNRTLIFTRSPSSAQKWWESSPSTWTTPFRPSGFS